MLKNLFVQYKGEVLTSAQLQTATGEGRTAWARRARVLERNGYTGQACSAGIEDRTQTGRPVKPVIDRHEAFSHGGPDDDANCASWPGMQERGKEPCFHVSDMEMIDEPG